MNVFAPLIYILIIFMVGCSPRAKSPEQVLKTIMIPEAQAFIRRNGLPYDSGLETSSVKKYSVDFYQKKPGCASNMTLTNGFYFVFLWDGRTSEIVFFNDGTKTSYNLARASKSEVQAVKALSLRNKLSEKSALELAKRFFALQGHKPEDFHQPEFGPYTWGQKGEADYVQYPFYMAQWYRKDANVNDRDKGKLLPNVTVTVSGINSNLIEYTKSFMPLGRDF